MTTSRGHLPESVRQELQLIYDLMSESGRWPTFRTVDVRFDRSLRVDNAQVVLREISGMYLEPTGRADGYYDSDEVRLTLRGIRECVGGEGDLRLLVEFIQWGSRLERRQKPTDEEDLVLGSISFAATAGLALGSDAETDDDLGYTPGQPAPVASLWQAAASEVERDQARLARLRLLIDLLPRFWNGMGSREPWRWQVLVDPRRFRAYRRIQDVDQLLDFCDRERKSITHVQLAVVTTLQGGLADVTDQGSGPDLRVELDAEGKSVGVEHETLSEGPIADPFDPELIDVTTRSPTVDLLLSRIRRGFLDLQPDFQRMAGIWSEQNQSRLIESMLLRIPLPTFYAAEAGDEKWIIVDGVQRLTTITRFIDPGSIGTWETPLTLRNLEYLKVYEGAKFADLPGRLQTRLLETELVLHLIRQGTPDQVMFNIFARINTGGRPLTRQELRHALIPGTARKLLGELAQSNSFLGATQGSVSPTRMDDREMVLRFIAFWLTPPESYKPDFDDFLRRAMREVNRLTRSDIEEIQIQFDRAMNAARDIFGSHAFRKLYPGQRRRSPINKALFEAVSVNLSLCSFGELETLRQRQADVVEMFPLLLESEPDFDQSISYGTGDPAKVRLRFELMRNFLMEMAHD